MFFSSRRTREIMVCGAALVFVALLAVGVLISARLVHLDLVVVSAIHAIAADGVTASVLELSALGGTTAAFVVMSCVALVLLLTRHWHSALALILSVMATQGLVHLIKGIVERSRPPSESSHIEAAGYSFPSAHSATSMALYGLLAVLAITHLSGRARIWASVLAALTVVLIGGTRIYLGAHYPTDVLAGWAVGAVVALVAWRGSQALRRLTDRSAPATAYC